jgi:hypothetical protein
MGSSDHATVFVVNGLETLELRDIRVGIEDEEGDAQIISGLEQGERIVSDGSLALKEGEPVLIQEPGKKVAKSGNKPE